MTNEDLEDIGQTCHGFVVILEGQATGTSSFIRLTSVRHFFDDDDHYSEEPADADTVRDVLDTARDHETSWMAALRNRKIAPDSRNSTVVSLGKAVFDVTDYAAFRTRVEYFVGLEKPNEL